jgi:hypothetical protein
MKRSYRHYLVIVGLLLLSVVATPESVAAQQAGERDKPLENSDVLAMKQAGIGEGVVIAAVKYAPLERLDSGAEALEKLRGAGVSEIIIAAITKRVEARQKAAASTDTTAGGHRSSADIKLYFTEKPAEPFRELGRVSAGKYGTLGRSRKREAVDEELKTKAAELGGDAVINITEDFASVSGVVIAFEKK